MSARRVPSLLALLLRVAAAALPRSTVNTACDCRFDLVMSCLVTEERWDSAEFKPGHEVYEVHHTLLTTRRERTAH